MTLRPMNETAQDRHRQDLARDRFAKHLIAASREARSQNKAAPLHDIKIETLSDIDGRASTLYRCDWAVFDRGKLVAWAEYKNRTPAKWSDYQTALLSLSKWMHMKTLAQQSLRPFFLVFEWSDALVAGRWSPHTGYGYEITWGGRYDRDQHGDAEPVIMIPQSEFKELR